MSAALLAVSGLLAGTVLAAVLPAGPASAATVTVTNGTQFTDTAGNPLHAHGGGVLKVDGWYYWFGENRNTNSTFRYVSVYRSQDLANWEFRNHVLTQATDPELASANIERPKVIYNPATKQFVMWMHKELASGYGQARAAVATSSTVDGDYSYRGSFRVPGDFTTRDDTLFQDTDGSGYFIAAVRNNRDLRIYRLTADYTAIDTEVANPWPDQYREAPALFKRGGVYFMLTSGQSGWSPNQQRYATASSLAGPWTAMRDVGDPTGYGSQTTFVLPVQGSSGTSYLYLGDRWGNSIGSNVQGSQYVWLPLLFPTARTMVLPYYPKIAIDATAGTVTGVGGGPYSRFVARHSGKCLDVSDNSAVNGAALLQWTCGGNLNQVYRFVDAGGGYVRIVAQHSGKCLDVSDESTADNAKVVQWRCGAGTNQQFLRQAQPDGSVRLVARHSGKCLDVANGSSANGTRLIQFTCGASAYQRFDERAA